MPIENERTIKFRGIDGWGRPVFKVLEKNYFIGSTDKLFSQTATEQEVVDYFKDRLNELVYFGCSFGCEPEGGSLKKELKLVLLQKDERSVNNEQ